MDFIEHLELRITSSITKEEAHRVISSDIPRLDKVSAIRYLKFAAKQTHGFEVLALLSTGKVSMAWQLADEYWDVPTDILKTMFDSVERSVKDYSAVVHAAVSEYAPRSSAA